MPAILKDIFIECSTGNVHKLDTSVKFLRLPDRYDIA